MTPSLYRETLKRAFAITRSHTYLWFFGFLAAFLGNGGEYEFVLNQFNAISSGRWGVSASLISLFGSGGTNIITFFADVARMLPSGSTVVLGGLSFILIMLAWVVISSQGALMRAVAHVSEGRRIALFEHFTAGTRSFWHLFGILAATRIGALLILLVVGAPLAALLMYVIEPLAALLLVLFVVGIPLFVVVSLIGKYAIAFRMIDNEPWDVSIQRALKLFADHWLVSLELALLLFAVNIVAGAVIVLFVFAVSMPFAILGNVLAELGSMIAGSIILQVGRVFGYAFLLVLGSALATFQYACWTELFLKISKKHHLSKLLRVVTGWREKYR